MYILQNLRGHARQKQEETIWLCRQVLQSAIVIRYSFLAQSLTLRSITYEGTQAPEGHDPRKYSVGRVTATKR